MLFLRFITSGAVEYFRVKQLKPIFVDRRDTFKLCTISRYLFLASILIPVLLISAGFFEFRGTIIAIISSILVFQELIVLIIIIFKIRSGRKPVKLRFIDKKYGAEIDR